MSTMPSLVWWVALPPYHLAAGKDPSLSSGTHMFGRELGGRVSDPQLELCFSINCLQSYPVSGPQFPCVPLGSSGVGLVVGRDLWRRWEENLEQPLPLLLELRSAALCSWLGAGLASLRLPVPLGLGCIGSAVWCSGDHLLQSW